MATSLAFSICPSLNSYSLDKTASHRGQRPPVLSWLRGHIWPDREQAGWEWQHVPLLCLRLVTNDSQLMLKSLEVI